MSNWYVRLSRRRFWDGDPAALQTLYDVLVTVAKLLAPTTPFVAEEIYQNLVVNPTQQEDKEIGGRLDHAPNLQSRDSSTSRAGPR
jgi:isoleucyl-tRNA synthetase